MHVLLFAGDDGSLTLVAALSLSADRRVSKQSAAIEVEIQKRKVGSPGWPRTSDILINSPSKG